MSNLADMTGMKIGRLMVLKRIGTAKDGHATWLCRCDCGNEVVVMGKLLRRGKTTSCGCYKKEIAGISRTKHGHTKKERYTPEYRAWGCMIQRCSNNKLHNYNRYGGRGIKVCEEWRNSFVQFFKDMGLRPSEKHTLDRINPDWDYTPSNCRWVTIETQNRNQGLSIRNKTGVRGVGIHKKTGKYAAQINVYGKTYFLGLFDDISEAAQARKSADEKYWGVTH